MNFETMIEFSEISDARGKLVSLSPMQNIPFEVQRIFYIYDNSKNLTRGQHAHYETKQLIIAIKGSCTIVLNDGTSEQRYKLSQPNVGVFQDRMIWGSMTDFSHDCTLLVLANTPYDPTDYITEYEHFLRLIE